MPNRFWSPVRANRRRLTSVNSRRALAVELQVDDRLAGGHAGLAAAEAPLGVGDALTLDLDRAEHVLLGAVVRAGDDRPVRIALLDPRDRPAGWPGRRTPAPGSRPAPPASAGPGRRGPSARAEGTAGTAASERRGDGRLLHRWGRRRWARRRWAPAWSCTRGAARPLVAGAVGPDGGGPGWWPPPSRRGPPGRPTPPGPRTLRGPAARAARPEAPPDGSTEGCSRAGVDAAAAEQDGAELQLRGGADEVEGLLVGLAGDARRRCCCRPGASPRPR